MQALSSEELLGWVERTSRGWRQLFHENPALLSLPCDIRDSGSLGELLRHIVAVELRYAQRLHGIRESPYEDISTESSDSMYAVHDQAMTLLDMLLPGVDSFWEDRIEFRTLSAGMLQATRRVVFVHLLMHSIRHYAQLATIVRQHGVKPAWAMDYLFMHTQPS